MRFTFLGTAAAEGIPGIFCNCKICEDTRKLRGKNIRTRSQALINNDLLIDLPPDTYMHTLYGGLDIHKIHECIITHDHQDHFYLEELFMRAQGFAQIKDRQSLNLYGSRTVTDKLNSYPIIRGMVEADRIKINEVKPFEHFFAKEYKITPLLADHSADNSLIYLIEKDQKRVLYAHDTGIFPQETCICIGGGIRRDKSAT